MRRLPLSLLPVALAAGIFLPLSAADAQQAAPPARQPVPPASVAMTPLSASVPDAALLAIPTPPGSKLRVEMDARSEDLLGMVKSFLKGIGETGDSAVKTPGAPPPAPNPITEALQSGNLAEVLKNVNHVHFAVWELTLPPAPPVPAASPMPGKPGAKPVKITTVAPPPLSLPAAPLFDSNDFFETAFSREGAHRILFTDADEFKLVMVGFPDRRGFAFAVSGAGYVAVSRTDGYPNMEALTAFVSHVTSAVMKTQAGKQILKDTVNMGGSETDTGDKGGEKK